MKVLSTGDLVADLIVPIRELPLRAEMHQLANERLFEAGGSCNFLIVASRLGLETQAVGAVGDDWLGDFVLQQLRDESVGVVHIFVAPNTDTTLSIALVDSNAEHVFVGALGHGLDTYQMPSNDDIFLGVGAVFCTSYALSDHSLFSPASSMVILEQAHEQGTPVFFDLGPAAFSIDRETIRRALTSSNTVLSTQDELLRWTECVNTAEAAAEIRKLGPETLVIKMGSRGCTIVSTHEEINVEGFEVTPRDTAGAGDAFAAAFVYGYLTGCSFAETGAIANATGAITVTRLGTGKRLPQRKEIFDLLQQHGFDL